MDRRIDYFGSEKSEKMRNNETFEKLIKIKLDSFPKKRQDGVKDLFQSRKKLIEKIEGKALYQ